MHTPEPWGPLMCDAHGRLTVIIARGPSIARALAMEPITFAEAEDNARRILACVNACQGIPTDALESGSLQVALDWARKAYAEGFRSEGLAEPTHRLLGNALKALEREQEAPGTTGSPAVALQLEVAFDANVTDAESLCSALDQLLETAMSTPGILEEYGNPEVGTFSILPPKKSYTTRARRRQ